MFTVGLVPLEPNLQLDLEKQAVHYIQISGYSDNAAVNYYYGKWRIITERAPAASSVALSCFRLSINNPSADNQLYTVFDRYGRIQNTAELISLIHLPQHQITRIEIHPPMTLAPTSIVK